MQPAPIIPPADIAPLKNPEFRRLLVFRLLIVFSYQIVAVVVGWHIYQLTRDPLSLGLIGLAEVFPYICTALFAGYAIDHYSRRMFGLAASVVLGFNSLLLAAIASGYFGEQNVLWIYASIAFIGFARAFIGPSYGALFALVLPREQYARAAGVGTSIFQLGQVLGPAVGGFLVGWADISTGYLVAASLAFASAVALLVLHVKEPPVAHSAPVFKSIGEGLRFVFSNQIILGAQALDMFAVLFGGAVAMLPAFIHDIYHYGPEGLGILRAAPAVGTILIGVVLARRPINHHAGKWLLLAVAGFGISIILFALTTYFWVAALLLTVSGVFDGVSVVLRATIFQLVTPDHMRGRVAAINGIFIGSSNELGAFESGLTARLMGLVPSVIFGGVMTLSVVLATARLAPKLRKLHLQDIH